MAHRPGAAVVEVGLFGSPTLKRSTGRYGPYTRPPVSVGVLRIRKPGPRSVSGSVGPAVGGRAPAPSTIWSGVGADGDVTPAPGPISARHSIRAPSHSVATAPVAPGQGRPLTRG